MAATLQDVVSANLVLVGVGLLNEPGEVEQFRNAIDRDMRMEFGLVANVPSGVTEPSLTLTLNRERIALNLSSSRSTITKEYPEQDDLDLLARVASKAIECTALDGQAPVAFGYNIELIFNQDSGQPALHYIGERLFGRQPLGKVGWNLIGGTGQLIFTDGIRQWKINVGSRPGDAATPRVVLTVNLHEDKRRFPTESEIKASLKEAWNEATEFMTRLD